VTQRDHADTPVAAGGVHTEKKAAGCGRSRGVLACLTVPMLRKHTGMSVSEWIQCRRLQLAHDRLARGQARSITELAFDLGFSSSAHFSTLFRRRFGVAPRDVWRGPAPSDAEAGDDGRLPPRTAA
ncbi:MAG: helix-turn-helix transcriptional regulator, partial [Thermaurantiacus sp.]